MAQVVLRPIVLPAVQELVLTNPSPALARRRHVFAEWLAFGKSDGRYGTNHLMH